jgi:hypothetical protein
LLAEKIGVSLAPLQPVDEDPLMAAVNLLELHWISVQEVLKLTRRVLTRIFVRLWPKKKTDMPIDDLKKLASVFDTAEDPILSMRSRSVKRGAEGAIILAYSHGEEVNWEKVSSYRGRPLSELLGFFEKAKKYAPSIVPIITPRRLLRLLRQLLRLLRQVGRCLRQTLVLPLPRLLLPQSLMLRWRRLSLPL